MKLIFFGTSDFSKIIFEALQKAGYSSIPGDISLGNYFTTFKKLNPDICVAAAYGKIIPKEYLEIPKHGFLNVHPSLLPKYRGATPIQTAILNGDKETGVTIILMDEKVDHGPVIAKKELRITDHDNYHSLEQKLAKLGAELLVEIMLRWVAGEIKTAGQNHSEATFTKKFSWQDGRIDWLKPAEQISRQIKALGHEPGVWAEWDPSTGSGQAGRVIKIVEAEPIESKLSAEPGKVIEIEDQIAVSCGRGALIIKEVQLEGRNKMMAADFVRGHQSFIGSLLN